MKCVKCSGRTAVVHSDIDETWNVRRRRKCKACGFRFTTGEVLIPPSEKKSEQAVQALLRSARRDMQRRTGIASI